MGTTFGRPHPLLLILFMVPALLNCGRTSQPTIAVVPKAQSHFFWQAVHAGAVSAANEAGYEVLWNGPASEADFAHQIRILDDLNQPAGHRHTDHTLRPRGPGPGH